MTQTVSASTGTWTPAFATFTYGYQWQIATTSGGTYTNIPNATTGTYSITSGDNTKFLKVVVTATATGYTTNSATSAATRST